MGNSGKKLIEMGDFVAHSLPGSQATRAKYEKR
jgi:hypothetical protein